MCVSRGGQDERDGAQVAHIVSAEGTGRKVRRRRHTWVTAEGSGRRRHTWVTAEGTGRKVRAQAAHMGDSRRDRAQGQGAGGTHG